MVPVPTFTPFEASRAKASLRELFKRATLCTLSCLTLCFVPLAAVQNAVTFQAQGAAARMLTGSDSKTLVSWQDICISGMFAGGYHQGAPKQQCSVVQLGLSHWQPAAAAGRQQQVEP